MSCRPTSPTNVLLNTSRYLMLRYTWPNILLCDFIWKYWKHSNLVIIGQIPKKRNTLSNRYCGIFNFLTPLYLDFDKSGIRERCEGGKWGARSGVLDPSTEEGGGWSTPLWSKSMYSINHGNKKNLTLLYIVYSVHWPNQQFHFD